MHGCMGLFMPFGSLVEHIEAVRLEHSPIEDEIRAESRAPIEEDAAGALHRFVNEIEAEARASLIGRPPANALGAMRERMANDMFRIALYIEEHGRQLIPADQAGNPKKPGA